MRIRQNVAGAVIAALVFAACGGGGESTLSQREFEDTLADICSRAQKKLDKIDPPAGISDIEDFAKDVAKVYVDTQERLADVKPPKDAASDFDDFKEVIDDQIKAIGDLEDAGKDEDEAKVNKALERIQKRDDDQAQIADDLGVDECAPDNDNGATDDTTPVATTVAAETTVAPETTVASETTEPPLTLPPTLPPVDPTQTTVPLVTVPPAPTGALFSVTSLVGIFNAPAGFTIVDSDATSTQAFVDVVAAVPALNAGISEMGVGVLLAGDGTPVATLVVGVANTDAMPGEWKDLLCGTSGVLRTSAEGFTGISCPGTPGTGVSDIFTLTEGDIGVSIASVIVGVSADVVADAFFTANF